MIGYKSILMAALLAVGSALSAQAAPKDHLSEIRAEGVQVQREGETLTISMDLLLDELRMGSNDLLILTPIIRAEDGQQEARLTPIMVAGRKRAQILGRQQALGNEPDYMTPAPKSIVTRYGKSAQRVGYSDRIARQSWMSHAILLLEEHLTGCAACDGGTATTPLLDRIISEPYKPTYTINYIEPKAEPIKQRSDTYSATINFRVAKYAIDRSYRNNASILDDVDAKVAALKDNKDLTISRITLDGWASPEGREESNRRLAENRAKSLADYLSATHGLRRTDMRVSGKGEDWAGVRRLISESSLQSRDALLDIIDSYDGDACDPKVRALEGGKVYRTLLDEIYPRVRRTDYTISYTVRPFDVEEAKVILKTNPKLLSLNEMYLVAQTYEVGSEDFQQVFDIAQKFFPSDAVAQINAAAAALEGGDHAGALRLLKRQESNPKAYNNLGIAYALSGDLDRAESYLRQAEAAGSKEAKANLSELAKLRESL